MTLALKPDTEPIPGYHVTERLGTGGYGEVWKAEAPGGLQKAIKFIYGYLSDEKATRELKALNRVKAIRHPFLLSIERIEVVEGQLVIVTELADGSLKDRFQGCKDAGLTAIPREELLAYLRDAADALDFLSENVLQHLDVKPENLLLVGGRTKVADFGLLKDIHDRTCSAMGGMTPVYAAPELFDGRPSATSDQYSLAIVYQEMLTGVLPFPGATAAQLTSQHLHSRPRLESLPASDVEIIAKALSKSPLDRFPSSRALIEALIRAGSGVDWNGPVRMAPTDGPLRETTAASGQDTSSVASEAKMPPRLSSRWMNARAASLANKSAVDPCESRTKTTPPAAVAIKSLPPIAVHPDEYGLRPTLVVGIGGTAAHILRSLRRRLHDRFGLENLPHVRTLLIDTDTAALTADTDLEYELTSADRLGMALRKPQEYREDSLEILQWLSRRWLYNIPRSLKTEGLRPLGRLALVDHAHVLFERLREAIMNVVAPESIEKAQQRTGLKLRNASPRVFVVSSISGGTGSGMVLDVAYVLRMLLADMGLSEEGLCGLLVHSTQRNATAKDLAVANAYACLSELNHYIQENGSQSTGDPLRTFQQHSTFPTAYFLHLGDRLSDDEFLAATDDVSEYLYLDAATTCGTFFDKCRAEVSQQATGDFQFRTFGLCQLDAGQDLPTEASEYLTRQVLEQWANGSTAARSAPDCAGTMTEDFPGAVISALKLDVRSLVDRFQSESTRSCSTSVITSLATMLVRNLEEVESETLDRRWMRLVLRAKQSVGLAGASDDRGAPAVCLSTLIDSTFARTFETLGTDLTRWVEGVVDGPGIGLAGALVQCERLIELLRQIEQDLNGLLRPLQETISLQSASVQSPATGRKNARRTDESPETMIGAISSLLSLLVEQKSVEGALRLAGALIHRLVTLNESLVRMRRETMSLAGSVRVSSHLAGSQPAHATQLETTVRQQLEKRLPKIAASLQRQIAQEITERQGGLYRLMSANGEVLRVLPAQIRSLARRAVMEELKQIDLASIALSAESDTARSTLARCVQSARPRALDCGGAQRVVVMLPTGPSAANLTSIVESNVKPKPTVLFDADCTIVTCFEGEQIGLRNLAAMLADNDPHCVEVAHRLHTRVDVKWATLESAAHST